MEQPAADEIPLVQNLEENKESKEEKHVAFSKSCRPRRPRKKATRKTDAVEVQGDLEVTKQGKEEDETKLSDTLAECFARADNFEKNHVLRSAETKAITKVAEILYSHHR